MSTIAKEIGNILQMDIADAQTKDLFKSRLGKEAHTRDQGAGEHFCVYFFPYNPEAKKVFLTHHKKSDLWISPGGHIDASDQSLKDALNREISEELGVKNFFTETPKPFLLTTVDIHRANQPCSRHLDIWYLVKTDGSSFRVDPKEFHTTRWMTIEEAKAHITDDANTKAVEVIEEMEK